MCVRACVRVRVFYREKGTELCVKDVSSFISFTSFISTPVDYLTHLAYHVTTKFGCKQLAAN